MSTHLEQAESWAFQVAGEGRFDAHDRATLAAQLAMVDAIREQTAWRRRAFDASQIRAEQARNQTIDALHEIRDEIRKVGKVVEERVTPKVIVRKCDCAEEWAAPQPSAPETAQEPIGGVTGAEKVAGSGAEALSGPRMDLVSGGQLITVTTTPLIDRPLTAAELDALPEWSIVRSTRPGYCPCAWQKARAGKWALVTSTHFANSTALAARHPVLVWRPTS